MSEAWRAATVTSFEQVPVGIANGLLRVVATSTVAASAAETRPILLADDGYTVARFRPVSAPPDVGETLRAGYQVPSNVINPATVFSLSFDDGFVIALPTPTHGRTRLRESGTPPVPEPVLDFPPTADAPEPLPVLDFVLDAAEARAELDAVRELAQLGPSSPTTDLDLEAALEVDAERRIAEERARTESAALELAAARDDVDDLRSVVSVLETEAADAGRRLELVIRERDEADAARARAETELAELRDPGARLAELEVWSGELERRLAETTTALADARAVAENDAAELQRLRDELAGDGSPAGSPIAGDDAGWGDDGALRAIGEAAFDDAHRQAERDLANPAS